LGFFFFILCRNTHCSFVLTVLVEVWYCKISSLMCVMILCVYNSGQNCETVSIGYFSLFFFGGIYICYEKTLANACMYAESISASTCQSRDCCTLRERSCFESDNSQVVTV
jgi:hypothetical protein